MTLSDLYADYEASLRTYAIGLTHDTDRADDLVQETFVRAMGHLTLLSQLKTYQRRSWLYQTLKNYFFDEQRREKRRAALMAQMVTTTDEPDLDTGLIVGEILDAVPDQYRDLLYQRYGLGMNSSEIAAELGVPAATIRSRLHLARAWIRRNGDLVGT